MPAFLRRILDTEPAVLVGTVVAVLALVGVTVAAEKVDLAVQILVVVLPLLGAGATRQLVSPAARVHEAAEAAYRDIEASGHPGNPLGGA